MESGKLEIMFVIQWPKIIDITKICRKQEEKERWTSAAISKIILTIIFLFLSLLIVDSSYL